MSKIRMLIAVKPIKIILAQDQEVFRKGVRSFLDENIQFQTLAEVSSFKQLSATLRRMEPDIVLLDADRNRSACKQALHKIVTNYKDIKTIILSMDCDPKVISEFIVLGARGYLSKYLSGKELIDKITMVYKDGYAIDQQIMHEILRNKYNDQGKSWLTEQETSVFEALRSGKKEAEIAADLNISKNTVHTHKKNMFKKTGTHSTAELINFINKSGWM